jgi:hypothetical protein
MKKLLIVVLTICFTTLFTSAKAQPETVYQYFKSATGKHFYTTKLSELGSGGLGYVREDNLGSIETTGPSNTAIYRFYNSTTTAHYYSLSNTPPPGFYFESILGYNATHFVYISGPVPVYQYHDRNGDFFYTTSNVTPTGYTADGAVFSVYPF